MSMFLSRVAPGYPTGLIDRTDYERKVPPWFIDSVNGTNAATRGRHPDAPLASLAYLITNASTMGLTAGDHVILMPEHNEGIANAQINITTADLKIYGHPNAIGDRVPTFDFDHANAEITLGAKNIYLGHVKLRPSVTAVLIGVEIATGITGCMLEDIEWMIGEDGAGVDEFVKAIRLVSGNHDTVMKDLKILAHASATEATHGIHVDAASDRLTFDNVVIDGPYATNGILEDAAGVNHVVVNCAVDVTGTDDGFNGSSTFAKRVGNEFGQTSDDGPISSIGTINATTTDVLHGKIGTDTEMADSSLFDMLAGAAGIASFPAEAAPANNVSIAEVLRAVYNDTHYQGLRCIEKTDGAVLTGDDNLFTITGGPIMVVNFVGIVTTVIGGASNMQINETVTTPAGTVNLSTNVAIDNDAAGTSYTFTAAAPSVLTPTTAGGLVNVPEVQWLCPIGTIVAAGSAAQTGVIAWYMVYRPLGENSVVTVAA